MKKCTWRERLEYFWMYYKIPFLATVFICAAILYFVHAKITEKDYAFNAILLDVHSDVNEEVLEEEFADYAGIDSSEKEVEISMSLLFSDAASGNYTMASLARLYTQIGTDDLDVCMMQKDDFEKYVESDIFVDLRDVFTEEELDKFPELYTDEQGRVLGVCGEGMKKIEDINGYSDQQSVAGILYNTKHEDTAKLFFEYLLEG